MQYGDHHSLNPKYITFFKLIIINNKTTKYMTKMNITNNNFKYFTRIRCVDARRNF